jgi:polysaccharide export outer membrane protein
MNPRVSKILCVAILVALPAVAQAQSNLPDKPGMAQSVSLLIGPGDLVHVSFFQLSELETKARVTDAGDIKLPLAGLVKVSGLDPAQASAAIARRYTDSNLLKSPQVSVIIEEYATQSVSVLGEVMHPGSFPVATPRSLMDVLAFAGGLAPDADRHIEIQHRGQKDNKQEVFLPNNAKDALAAQVSIYPGDLVLVPRAGIVYVLGDVVRPGGYVMQDDSTLTVLQAVALASGTSRTASEGHARLVRRTTDGYKEIPVPLKEMEKGKVADMALQHDDILWVPFSYGKNFAISGASIVGVAGAAAVYHF